MSAIQTSTNASKRMCYAILHPWAVVEFNRPKGFSQLDDGFRSSSTSFMHLTSSKQSESASIVRGFPAQMGDPPESRTIHPSSPLPSIEFHEASKFNFQQEVAGGDHA